MPISGTEFEELLSMLDRHAGRTHSRDGRVAQALQAILERHAQMLLVHRTEKGSCLACEHGCADPSAALPG